MPSLGTSGFKPKAQKKGSASAARSLFVTLSLKLSSFKTKIRPSDAEFWDANPEVPMFGTSWSARGAPAGGAGAAPSLGKVLFVELRRRKGLIHPFVTCSSWQPSPSDETPAV